MYIDAHGGVMANIAITERLSLLERLEKESEGYLQDKIRIETLLENKEITRIERKDLLCLISILNRKINQAQKENRTIQEETFRMVQKASLTLV